MHMAQKNKKKKKTGKKTVTTLSSKETISASIRKAQGVLRDFFLFILMSGLV